MEKLEVGIRIRPAEGVAFFGLDEVNQRIAAGARVVAVEPGSLVMEKTGEEDGHVQMLFSGCQILVVLEGPEEA